MSETDPTQQPPAANPQQQSPENDEHPQVVYMARPLEPQKQPMSPEIIAKHE